MYQQNQQNSYQQQAYSGQQGYGQQQAYGGQQGYSQQQQAQGQQVYLQDQDLAKIVLSELKRIGREYTIATQEATNPQIRQIFQALLQKTLQDQALVFQEIQQLGGYGEIPEAPQQDIQKELQKQSQTASKLQSFVQQNLSRATIGQQQSQDQGNQQQGFRPSPAISGASFSNAIPSQGYGQDQSNQSPVSWTGSQVQSYGPMATGSQGMSQNQNMGSSYGNSSGSQPAVIGYGSSQGYDINQSQAPYGSNQGSSSYGGSRAGGSTSNHSSASTDYSGTGTSGKQTSSSNYSSFASSDTGGTSTNESSSNSKSSQNSEDSFGSSKQQEGSKYSF
jgi:spore coat protein CotF